MNNQVHIVAIYGGTFDPVHLGHIKIALHVLAQPEISQLRLLPCYSHPAKSKIYASPTHRYNMLKLVTKNSLIVDCFELERRGISYTIDSAQHIRTTLGADVPIALLLGLDAYAEIEHWYNATQLPSLLHLIVVARPQIEFNNNENGWQRVNTLQKMAQHPAGDIFFMSEPYLDICSRQIRSMIAQGIQPRYLLPGVIWNYIKRNRLYNYQATQ